MAQIIDFNAALGTIENNILLRAKAIGCTNLFRKALMAATILQHFQTLEECLEVIDEWKDMNLIDEDEQEALRKFYGN